MIKQAKSYPGKMVSFVNRRNETFCYHYPNLNNLKCWVTVTCSPIEIDKNIQKCIQTHRLDL